MAHIKKESHMDMESMSGKMVKTIKVNGLMEWKMDQEYGEDHKVIRISDNGKIVKHKVMEFTLGSMVIDTKGNLNNALSMVKEYKNLQMVTYTKVITKMENLMVKESIFGTMEVHIRVNLSKDFVLGKVHGENQIIQVLIHMKEIS